MNHNLKVYVRNRGWLDVSKFDLENASVSCHVNTHTIMTFPIGSITSMLFENTFFSRNGGGFSNVYDAQEVR